MDCLGQISELRQDLKVRDLDLLKEARSTIKYLLSRAVMGQNEFEEPRDILYLHMSEWVQFFKTWLQYKYQGSKFVHRVHLGD